MFKNKNVLITGGTGTWGQELARQLLKKGAKEIKIFSRNEAAQVEMRNKFGYNPNIIYIIGDVRDANSIKESCWNIQYVFHTAALKHVTVCENQPREAVETNIYGTQNVINACIDKKVEVCVNISSDKACYANCFYGKTKAVAEGLITEANNQTLDTDFISIRSGNIFGSSGSVVPLWIRQIKERNYIYVTGGNMRRFFITVEDAVKATFRAMAMSDRGEIFVPKMDCFQISDLAEILVKIYGNAKTEIRMAEAFPYERDNEWLLTPEESRRSVENKYFYVVYPLIDIKTAVYPVITDSNRLKNGIRMKGAKISGTEILWKLVKRAGY